ncbi:MAG: hypothetical protein NC833_04605 [Candidatus Omnitrophica bacterium]|nr:hypothetical protein [Candidatus Omnitrophota bacterium]
MDKKCYFHPDFNERGQCASCGRYVCNACMRKKEHHCWACSPLVSGIETTKRIILVSEPQEKDIDLPFGRRKNLKTKKLLLFCLEINENNRPIPGQLFCTEILALHCLIWPPVSQASPDKIIPIIVYFEDKKFSGIKSMWLETHKRLICTGIDVRKFTGILGRIILLLVTACLSYLLAMIYTLLTKNISFLEFLKQGREINYWVFLLSFFLIGLLLRKYFIFPCRWSPTKVEITGVIKDYKIDEWEIVPSGKHGYRAFITLIDEIGGERHILLEWTRPIQIEKENENKIKKKKKVGSVDKEKYLESSEDMKKYLEDARTNNKNLKFVGRELYNVLICNLDDRQRCKVIEKGSQIVSAS